ncbi:MAG: hypothetical protein QOE92_1740 [Chloroflexota bacterium]|jgi:DNA-binding protein HU-beta|nr:hypothetical protein [Chloroflexota bacterium]
MAESASAPTRTARKRATTRRRTTAKKSTARRTTAAATTTTTGRKRGRPVGSRNKRTTSATPAAALTKRVQALVKENALLKEQVKDLEKGWRKLEKALGANVTRAKRTVRRRARAATRQVNKAIDSVTS